MVITDVLNRSKAVARFYGDGSFDCPFCHSAVVTPKITCENPWCIANPMMPVPAAQKIVADIEQKEKEEAARKRNTAIAMQRIQDDRDRQSEWYARTRAEAESRGACVTCALVDGPYGRRPRFVKHRNGCTRKGN